MVSLVARATRLCPRMEWLAVEAIQSIGPELVTVTAGAGATPAQ